MNKQKFGLLIIALFSAILINSNAMAFDKLGPEEKIVHNSCVHVEYSSFLHKTMQCRVIQEDEGIVSSTTKKLPFFGFDRLTLVVGMTFMLVTMVLLPLSNNVRPTVVSLVLAGVILPSSLFPVFFLSSGIAPFACLSILFAAAFIVAVFQGWDKKLALSLGIPYIVSMGMMLPLS